MRASSRTPQGELLRSSAIVGVQRRCFSNISFRSTRQEQRDDLSSDLYLLAFLSLKLTDSAA